MRNVTTLFLSLVAFLTSVLYSHAQITWEPLGGPAGTAEISEIIPLGDDEVFMVKNNEIWRSTNRGDTWLSTTNGSSNNVGTLMERNGSMYRLQYQTLSKYDATQNTWNLVTSLTGGFSGSGLGIDDQARIWRASGGSLNYSLAYKENGAGAFTVIPLSGDSIKGWFDQIVPFNDDHNLIACSYGTNQNLFHFTKSGTVNQVYNGYLIDELVYHPTNGTAYLITLDTFMRSTDGGLSWQGITLPTSNSWLSLYDTNIEFAPNGKTWLFTNEEAFYTTDNGATWTNSLIQIANYSTEHYVSESNVWYTSGNCYWEKFSRSEDEWSTWQPIGLQFLEPPVETLERTASGKFIAKLCDYTLETSSDDGQTWSKLQANRLGQEFPIWSYQEYADGTGNTAIAAFDNYFWRTTDGGTTWDTILTALTFLASPSNVAHNPYSKEYLTFDIFGASKSIDGGNTWQPIPLLNTWFDYPEALAYAQNGNIFISDFYSAHLYSKEKNTVSTFNLTTLGFVDAFKSAAFTPNNDLFVLAEISFAIGMYRIPSGDSIWIPVATNAQGIPFTPTSITSDSDGRLFALADTTIYVSYNNGNDWQSFTQFSAPGSQWNRIKLLNDGRLYNYSYYHVPQRTQRLIYEKKLLTQTWLDINQNCTYEGTEQALSNVKILAEGANGSFLSFTNLDGSSAFSMPTGTYSANAVPPNALYTICKPDTNIVFDNLTDTVMLDLPLKGVEQCSYLSVSASTALLRRCFENYYVVHYANEGTAAAPNAYIELQLDSLFDFVSASIPFTQLASNTLSFQLGDLAPGARGSFFITIKVNCDASLGQTHCIEARIYPQNSCPVTLADKDTYTECRPNIGAFDPNDKTAFVHGMAAPSHIAPGETIEYLIRFQNTGTDTAFTVVIEDKISPLLDLGTFRMIANSHPYRIETRADRTLRFIFEHIMLPDSNINEPASHGFVKFSIDQAAAAQLGQTIKNEADIFFDFNLPVRTNTSTLQIGIINTFSPPISHQIEASPNPFHDFTKLVIKSNSSLPEQFYLQVFDVLGREVHTVTFAGKTHRLEGLLLPPGVYIYRLSYSGQTYGSGKLVKQ